MQASAIDLYRYAPQENQGMRPWRALGMVHRHEFESPDYQFIAPPFSGDAPVLEGRVQEVELQPGLWLHCAEVVDLHSMASRVWLDEGLRLVMIIAGELDVTIGGHRIHLRPDHVSAAVVSMAQPALFERRWQRGKWERKLSLHLTADWLRAHAAVCGLDQKTVNAVLGNRDLSPPPGSEVCVVPWVPSPHAISLAEQLILGADESASPVMRLRQAARAFEILYEALSEREAAPVKQTSGLRLRDHERMVRVRAFLDHEIRHPFQQALPIAELGQQFGLSASALQRQFRRAFSCTVDEYRRNMRLLRARAELEQGSTIAAAAERAGYGSAANFSTAFRRQFGLSPSAVRQRI
ncbi:AraC family transcriptional regulator [Achromobacter sp. F4_2707]|uniref:helix-turn-helix transcriptional regulator n=1 Tax=Achromobacter sp. F4_2707 TaxID=3114286 RepID=UPI0039C6ECB7